MRFLAVPLLFAANDITPQHGVPKTRVFTETVSRFGEATTCGKLRAAVQEDAGADGHNTGNDCSAPAPDERGSTTMQGHMSISATMQLKPTDKVSLCPDSAASLRQELKIESCSDDEPLATSCLRVGRFHKERAWHEQDRRHIEASFDGSGTTAAAAIATTIDKRLASIDRQRERTTRYVFPITAVAI